MQAKKAVRPYGGWPSPIEAGAAARGARRFGRLQADGDWVYWSESRPDEGGRQVIVRARVDGEAMEELLPPPYSARSRVHEYGGGEFLVADGTIYFINDADQDIYAMSPHEAPARLTRERGMRFGDVALDVPRDRLIAVAERHARLSNYPENLLVGVGLAGRDAGKITDLARGHDFFAFPRLSPAGDRLAYIAWDLPDMPWDQSRLFVAPVTRTGTLGKPVTVAGGDGEAASQPQWAEDGTLYFVLDGKRASGLRAWKPGQRARRVKISEGEISRPLWMLGAQAYALGANGEIAACTIEQGESRFTVAPRGRTANTGGVPKKVPFRGVDNPVACENGYAAFATYDNAAPAIVSLGATTRVLRRASDLELEPGMVSRGRSMEFRDARGRSAWGVFYRPVNSRCQAPKGARPPLVMLVHGGPTSMAERGLKLRVQFLTTRGFAVLDLDYSGSTGYGRAYRERLDGRWGELDVADATFVAEELARRRLVDGERMAIAGGSAGGYTVLMALATTQVFAAGSSHYGISDLGLLLAHTHKFESGYLHRLMGTTPDNWRPVFEARSPLLLAGGISSPVILFQGLEDRVVPPEQSRRIVDELRKRQVDVEYHEFAGEGHGFRRAETIIATLDAELAFFRRVMRLA